MGRRELTTSSPLTSLSTSGGISSLVNEESDLFKDSGGSVEAILQLYNAQTPSWSRPPILDSPALQCTLFEPVICSGLPGKALGLSIDSLIITLNYCAERRRILFWFRGCWHPSVGQSRLLSWAPPICHHIHVPSLPINNKSVLINTRGEHFHNGGLFPHLCKGFLIFQLSHNSSAATSLLS